MRGGTGARLMDDRCHVTWADAVLRRPAVDPDIPRAHRVLLTAPGTLLTPASRTRPARTRDYLPADPARREATVEGAVIGLVTAGAARAYHGRYLTGADFDARARFLLRRAQDAVDAVTTSEVYRAGFLDAPAALAALADQEWDIAVALREQARLRAQRAEPGLRNAGAMTAALRNRQSRAAQLADSSIAARVAALERYAAQVREADAAYRDWQQARGVCPVPRRPRD
jgi:hypothetical protein